MSEKLSTKDFAKLIEKEDNDPFGNLYFLKGSFVEYNEGNPCAQMSDNVSVSLESDSALEKLVKHLCETGTECYVFGYSTVNRRNENYIRPLVVQNKLWGQTRWINDKENVPNIWKNFMVAYGEHLRTEPTYP